MSPSAPAPQEKREFASEMKFLIDAAKAAAIRAWARERLVSDPNAHGVHGDTYQVESIYFDNDAFDVFHHRTQLHHSKFRIRRYGATALFLERKLKVHGRLAKRRTPVVAGEILRLTAPDAGAPWSGQWFQRKLAGRNLHPVCQIAYQRTARVVMSPNGPIRLTLDDSIRGARANGIAFHDASGEAIPLTPSVVLELKFRRDLPALFRELAERFALTPRPFSKYRAAVTALGLAPAALPGADTDKTLACQTS